MRQPSGGNPDLMDATRILPSKKRGVRVASRFEPGRNRDPNSDLGRFDRFDHGVASVVERVSGFTSTNRFETLVRDRGVDILTCDPDRLLAIDPTGIERPSRELLADHFSLLGKFEPAIPLPSFLWCPRSTP